MEAQAAMNVEDEGYDDEHKLPPPPQRIALPPVRADNVKAAESRAMLAELHTAWDTFKHAVTQERIRESAANRAHIRKMNEQPEEVVADMLWKAGIRSSSTVASVVEAVDALGGVRQEAMRIRDAVKQEWFAYREALFQDPTVYNMFFKPYADAASDDVMRGSARYIMTRHGRRTFDTNVTLANMTANVMYNIASRTAGALDNGNFVSPTDPFRLCRIRAIIDRLESVKEPDTSKLRYIGKRKTDSNHAPDRIDQVINEMKHLTEIREAHERMDADNVHRQSTVMLQEVDDWMTQTQQTMSDKWQIDKNVYEEDLIPLNNMHANITQLTDDCTRHFARAHRAVTHAATATDELGAVEGAPFNNPRKQKYISRCNEIYQQGLYTAQEVIDDDAIGNANALVAAFVDNIRKLDDEIKDQETAYRLLERDSMMVMQNERKDFFALRYYRRVVSSLNECFNAVIKHVSDSRNNIDTALQSAWYQFDGCRDLLQNFSTMLEIHVTACKDDQIQVQRTCLAEIDKIVTNNPRMQVGTDGSSFLHFHNLRALFECLVEIDATSALKADLETMCSDIKLIIANEQRAAVLNNQRGLDLDVVKYHVRNLIQRRIELTISSPHFSLQTWPKLCRHGQSKFLAPETAALPHLALKERFILTPPPVDDADTQSRTADNLLSEYEENVSSAFTQGMREVVTALTVPAPVFPGVGANLYVDWFVNMDKWSTFRQVLVKLCNQLTARIGQRLPYADAWIASSKQFANNPDNIAPTYKGVIETVFTVQQCIYLSQLSTA